jgi:hypothetical protein
MPGCEELDLALGCKAGGVRRLREVERRPNGVGEGPEDEARLQGSRDVDAVGSAVRNLVHSVTESGKALNYRKDFFLPDMGSGNGSWAGADNMLQVSTAGGKTGAGEVAVVVEYVVNAGCA